ncbi:MAG TPA: ABC transporter permease subunit [Spirochaetia bacterium]|nr:ABC transporter permease subunit [Spirochaetia bacterium]
MRRIANDRVLYLMLLPFFVYFVVFHYIPLFGNIIAFKRYSPARGIFESPWVGFSYFQQFFTSSYFWRVLRNTVVISLSTLIVGFPAPIILALMLNEVRSTAYKRIIQSVTYLPHFVSLVVVAGLIVQFSTIEGLFNDIVVALGGRRIPLLQEARLFVPIYVTSEVWQTVGWGSIIYLSALSTIDPNLYEAAVIDGAGRFRQLLAITLPSLLPTIVVLLILRTGRLLTVGHEKIILLYNPLIYETSDVITTFVYRKGLIDLNWSYSTAVGLLNSVVNGVIIVSMNALSRRVSETSLW